MGAGSRKINNARAQATFDAAQSVQRGLQTPGAGEEGILRQLGITRKVTPGTSTTGPSKRLFGLNIPGETKTGPDQVSYEFGPSADEDALRSRAMRPIQAAYEGATRDINRAKSLGTPGSSGSLIAAMAKLNRGRTQQLSDATNDVNASIADRRMSALSQLSQIEQGRQGLGLNSIGTMQQNPRNEGFGWGKLFGGLATLGSGFLTGGAGGMKPANVTGYTDPHGWS